MSWATCALLLAASLRGPEGSILAEIQGLDQRLAQAEADVAGDKARRDVALRQLQQIEAAAAHSQKLQAAAWAQLKLRVQALARLPATTPVSLFQSGTSFADALADLRLLGHIAAHDRALHDTLVAKGAALLALETERQQQQALFDRQAQESAARHDRLVAQRQKRRAWLASIRSQASAKAALGSETQVARQRLGAMVQAPGRPSALGPTPSGAVVQHSAFAAAQRPQNADPRLEVAATQKKISAHKGKLAWPAAGAVRVAFGERIDLAYGTITAHNGWDIGAPLGSRVQAIGPGRIVFADWLHGYGQVVIVDHQDALHAVVAHLGSIDVNVGDAVVAGQSLGTVGETGSLRGPVLYFELRHKGAPVDPKGWLRR